jgi:hypothetical protein
MTRCRRIPLVLLAVLAVAPVALPLTAIAQPKAGSSPSTLPQDSSSSNEPKTKEQLEAQQHFQRAKDLYQTGAYREAIAELEAARLLDPKAKDLVFNLGIVHEKLGKFDEAIAFFRQYMELETVTAVERAKAENIIKRIEGAKREVPVTPTATGTSTAVEPRQPPEDTSRGRIDAATITAGSFAIVGLGVGAVFGILALSNKPDDFVTGRDGSFATLQTQTDDAHTQAIISDVGFGVGIAAAVVTAILYFGRTKEPARTGAAQLAPPRVLPSATILSSGGAFTLGGSFQ